MTARGILVTGTDTGIGKTVVSCAILRTIVSSGGRAAPLKPVETGCALGPDGRLVAADAERMHEAAGGGFDPDDVCPIRLEEPLAPWIAAERAGTEIDLARIERAYSRLASAADTVVVESAGGLLVPLRRDVSFADLARDLGLEVLVVVGSRLGVLNTTLLTVEALAHRGLPFLGWVSNRPTPTTDLAIETNDHALTRLLGRPPLATIPHLPDPATPTLPLPKGV